jgi:hypothetical protein
MKNNFLFCLLFILIGTGFPAFSQQNPGFFETWFEDRTMRIDFEHLGDSETEWVVFDRAYSYGYWAGSVKNLIDTFHFGYFRYLIEDVASGERLFAREYNSNFGEYEVTPMARAGEKKAFHESALFPEPKSLFRFVLQKRGEDQAFFTIFSREMDPAGFEVIRETTADPGVMVFSGQYNGDSKQKIDLVFVAEGYESAEIFKFEKDLNRFTEAFFEKEPLRSNRNHFNVWGVFKASPDSGVDQPRHHSFRKTHVGASFNSFNIERYLLIEDNKALRDIAGHAPYDAVLILVNTERYGGAGMYNLYCTMTSDNEHSAFLMVHEFGHSFFGLADEYYTSEVGFEDLYGAGYEPIEANITALNDPAKLKWRHLMEPDTPLPTPWQKEKYDAADEAWQAERGMLKEQIAELTRNQASTEEIRAAEEWFVRRDQEHGKQMYDWLHNDQYSGMVGAFEGAGYTSTGMYRPSLDCIMFSKKADAFCPVCSETMQKIIDWYCE